LAGHFVLTGIFKDLGIAGIDDADLNDEMIDRCRDY
jgi:hypothetical protein